MVLRYKFEYLSNNSGYISILDNILKNKEIENYKILRDDDFITFFIEDKEETLIKVSDELSTQLPLSIFLKDFALEVVPQIPPEDYRYTLDSCQKSYCSNCLAEIENKKMTNYYNPFINCQVCGTTSNAKSLDIYKNSKKYEFKTLEESFSFLVKEIKDNRSIKIKNSKMEFIIKKFDSITKENQDLIVTNIDELSSLVVGSKQKSIALLSYEKPTIPFNINAIYQKNHNIDFEHVNITYSWDLVLYILCRELKNSGINFLTMEKEGDSDIEVNYENSYTPPKAYFSEKRIFLVKNSSYEKRLDDLYNKFDEPSKSQFLVLLDENRLYEKSILNIFLSTKKTDAVTLYSPKIDGFVDILKFTLPKSIASVFEEIEKQEGGERLLQNYKIKFPQNYENAINSDISNIKEKSIFSLWRITQIVLGVDDIYSNASKSLLQKGPSIDYKYNKDKNFNKSFDYISLIKSGISFKLAGIDDKTLSLGYVENFFYMLGNLVDEVQEENTLDGISFCGDIFASDFIDKLVNKTFNKTLKLYYNKDFPIQL